MNGIYTARSLAAATLASKTAVLRSLNFSISPSSRAKMRTMRDPTTFSSATEVTSAIFCCTSRRIGCNRRLKRTVAKTRNGANARDKSASSQLRTNSTTVTAAMVNTLAVKKTMPYPRNMRTFWMSVMPRDMSWPVGQRSK